MSSQSECNCAKPGIPQQDKKLIDAPGADAPVIKDEGQKTGSVLIIGGGVGGIQAALDLAESGYYVYLVEESPAIGGVMPQLDKTFPTNDCSMCILSPKLVECGRHPNIQLITYADVVRVEGRPGKFKVSVRKKARYVDTKKCTGCGVCYNTCPVKNMAAIPPEEGQDDD
jgi:heterodisulfide reductase subunit A-like polyferredoxin